MACNTSTIYCLNKDLQVTKPIEALFIKKVIHKKYHHYDFVTKEEERITKDSRDQSYPKVEGSKVFWLDNARDQSKKEQGINNLYYEDF